MDKNTRTQLATGILLFQANAITMPLLKFAIAASGGSASSSSSSSGSGGSGTSGGATSSGGSSSTSSSSSSRVRLFAEMSHNTTHHSCNFHGG